MKSNYENIIITTDTDSPNNGTCSGLIINKPHQLKGFGLNDHSGKLGLRF